MQDIAEENKGAKGEGLVRQQSAVQHATTVLLSRQAAPDLVLTYLPWLIATSPHHALLVLKVLLLLLLLALHHVWPRHQLVTTAQPIYASLAACANLHDHGDLFQMLLYWQLQSASLCVPEHRCKKAGPV